MSDTWPYYGQLAAERIYNVTNGGYVTHGSTDTFGYSGMIDGGSLDAQIWADYQAGPTWMMEQVKSYHDYYGNASWFQSQGYPLLKSTALFWLEFLQPDNYFNDGTLVAAPCNSPEHGPVTFGCAHYQQLIFELFDTILSTYAESGDSDEVFHAAILDAYQRLDRGVRVGPFGELQEWKIGSFDMANDTHRHLSHLVGLYPGYALSGTDYAQNTTITDAIATTLRERGNGTGPDANAGWEKVWRAACWATLNNTSEAYNELKYAIDTNYAPNGLSMYSGTDPPFQIDANYGLAGAVLAMLVRDVPRAYGDDSAQTVVLGPAIPAAWKGGVVLGLRIRGGGTINFNWDDEGVVQGSTLTGRDIEANPVRIVNKNGFVVG